MTELPFQEVCNVINQMPDSKVYLAKPEFMTIRCRVGGQDVDLTWPRFEGGYSDGRHPDFVAVASSLREDAMRRDFTINAMYMRADGEILDFYDGASHLKRRIIKTTDDPEKTFADDYLRMARAWRFSCTLGLGWVIEHFTSMAIVRNVKKLIDVPFERVQNEINKGLLADPQKMFFYMNTYNVLDILAAKGLTFMLTAKER
jgi:tRNA nucleotidyltransferase (CCA-adding enzyme)